MYIIYIIIYIYICLCFCENRIPLNPLDKRPLSPYLQTLRNVVSEPKTEALGFSWENHPTLAGDVWLLDDIGVYIGVSSQGFVCQKLAANLLILGYFS